MRVPMNMVPLEPITMVRAAGWPCDQISALKPGGSLARPTGIFSSGDAVGGCGLPFKFGFCLLLEISVLSIGLKPGRSCAFSVAPPTTSAAAVAAIANILGVMLFMSDVLPLRCGGRWSAFCYWLRGYADLLRLRRGPTRFADRCAPRFFDCLPDVATPTLGAPRAEGRLKTAGN